jgi:hypothetical protein
MISRSWIRRVFDRKPRTIRKTIRKDLGTWEVGRLLDFACRSGQSRTLGLRHM